MWHFRTKHVVSKQNLNTALPNIHVKPFFFKQFLIPSSSQDEHTGSETDTLTLKQKQVNIDMMYNLSPATDRGLVLMQHSTDN